MAKAISNDLRKRIVDAVDAGSSRRAAAERFDVAPSTAVNVVLLRQQTGSLNPKPRGGDKRSGRIEAYADEILRLIESRPDITLAEIAAHLEQTQGEGFAVSTIWRFFKRRGISYKKNGACQRAGPPGRGGTQKGVARNPS